MSRLEFFVPFQKGRDGKPRPHPGTNELVEARGINRYAYAGLKRTYTRLAMSYAYEAAAKARWRAPEGPVRVLLEWREANRRRDPDNVRGGCKWLLDGIVKAGALRNDSQRYVAEIYDRFTVDKENPGVMVALVEKEESR